MKTDELARRGPQEVLNQPPVLEDYNLLEQDAPLREGLNREGAEWALPMAGEFGELLGKAENLEHGRLANANPPTLQTHDRFGNRIDEVRFHPSWHELLKMGIAYGNHAMPWTTDQPGAHVARAAMSMMRHQLDEGSSCPLTMTFASIPTLRMLPSLAEEWEPRILSTEYDSRFVPAYLKRGALIGMAMTERQGGSDVRSNTTRAAPIGRGGPGSEYSITGHKWFCSAPMCDAFFVLAQTPGGLSCFFMPRFKPDGSLNRIQIQRLKDKLGNRSNASSEVEFHGAYGLMVGDIGEGVRTIIEMVRHTRLDCAFGSAATMRRAVAEATHHAHHRFAFDRSLSSHPLMKNVLADLCLESEAATALSLRLARSFDEAPNDPQQASFCRIATAIGKYWLGKRAISAVAEALECLGGNGYVEDGPLARLYRDVPLNSLWEGSGNIQCLDVLRTLNKDPGAGNALLTEIRNAMGSNPMYDRFVEFLEKELQSSEDLEPRARRVAEWTALALQGSLLVQHAPNPIADAFCASRLAGDQAFGYGTLPPGTDFDAIIERARPKLD